MTTLPIDQTEASRLNKDYLIRFYPIQNNRHTNRLISLNTFFALVEDAELALRLLDRVQDSPEQKTTVKLRRGVAFTFVYR